MGSPDRIAGSGGSKSSVIEIDRGPKATMLSFRGFEMSDPRSSEPVSPDVSPQPSQSIRGFIKPVVGWVLGCGLAFGVLAVGMEQVAKQLPVDSPALAISEGEAAAAGGADPATARSYPAPSFRLTSLEGREIGPQDFLGRVVVIDLWASWCGPCRIQAQHFETLHREYDADEVQFLAINSGEDLSTVQSYAERTPFSYPVLMDPNETVMRRYQATGLPTVMVVDITGQISFLRVGTADPATLRREIEKAKRPNQQLAV